MKVTPAAYGHLIHSLMSFAEGQIGVFLEGGKKIPCPNVLYVPFKTTLSFGQFLTAPNQAVLQDIKKPFEEAHLDA